nr:MAG TPA: hypothetical protein [Caudoviricetes sp.]DAR69345.1 MAG TPA: hypothetical protein [Caudoviricetes sp.]
MKIGVRKPSLKKSFKAMTTGALKRKIKKAVIPGYGKKGTGILKNPKKAVYNKVYNKTTVNLRKKNNSKTEESLILNMIIWIFTISFFVAIAPFYLIYYIFKKK